MDIATIILALYVFLQSVPAFGWFTVDPKFTAFIGIVFVVIIAVEALWHPITVLKKRAE